MAAQSRRHTTGERLRDLLAASAGGGRLVMASDGTYYLLDAGTGEVKAENARTPKEHHVLTDDRGCPSIEG